MSVTREKRGRKLKMKFKCECNNIIERDDDAIVSVTTYCDNCGFIKRFKKLKE